ncbi:hypothetical protein RRF57_004161 [Xylaria bambusicola]|uniref:Uncharacterized protein n=1 Tax=Xylaria bambusicola TaxID=326684 RepID=A0AAN7Z8E5_9PEZI
MQACNVVIPIRPQSRFSLLQPLQPPQPPVLDLITLQPPQSPQPSPASQPSQLTLRNPITAHGQGVVRPVVIPPGVDQNEVDRLGEGANLVIRIAPLLRAEPVPGPTLLLYNIDGIEPITNALLNLPHGDPERADVRLLQFPRPDHPNPHGLPALRTIPDNTIINEFQPLGKCLEIYPSGNVCQRPCASVCEDIIHGEHCESPVCIPCNNVIRRRFQPALAEIARSLRAYACGPCSSIAQDPANLAGKRLRVWGVQPNAFDGDLSGPNKSTSMGLPKYITGCNCATKLLDRFLCTAHRLEHFLRIRAQAQDLRQYISSVFGRQACPFCLNRVGIDSYGFRDPQGNPFPNIIYTCLSCFGVVSMPASIHDIIGPNP